MFARVHSIETMGLLDGPGIRTVIFLQGCPLRCLYCHNPDSQAVGQGSLMSADEIISLVKRYARYYGAEGGVTFSGGEPLLQGEFLAEILPRLKNEGISTCIDTSGVGNPKFYKDVLPYVDTILLDVKAFTSEDFKQRMRGNFDAFLKFMNTLEQNRFHGQIWVRHVMVPGWSDNEKAMDALVDTIEPIAHFVDRIEILPYHVMGVAKYEELGIEYELTGVPAMDEKIAKEYSNYANKKFAERVSVLREQRREEAAMKTQDLLPENQLQLDDVKRIIEEHENLDLFNEVEGQEREEFLASIEYFKLGDGMTVFKPGDPGDRMYVLLTGSMKIVNFTVDGYEQILYVYGPGDFIGGHNVQFDVSYHYLGEMLEDSIIAVITKDQYQRFLADKPKVLMTIMHKSFERIRWAEDLIARLSSNNATMKVAALLLQFKDSYGETDAEGRVFVRLPIDRDEMGSYVGLPRETVNRKLGEFKELGYIDYEEKQVIEIRNFEALREYSF